MQLNRFRGEIIALNVYFRKRERYKIRGLRLYLIDQKKKSTVNPKLSRKKEVIRIKAESVKEKTKKNNVEKVTKLKLAPLKRTNNW